MARWTSLIGSAIMKTFYYPTATGTDAAYRRRACQPDGAGLEHRPVGVPPDPETRVLVRQPDGTWTGLLHVWDADQKDATLKIGGASVNPELVGSGVANEKPAYGVRQRADLREVPLDRDVRRRGHPAHRAEGAQHEQVVRLRRRHDEEPASSRWTT